MTHSIHPLTAFRAFGLEWLFRHATVIPVLTGPAREAQLDELRIRLRDRGLSPPQAAFWADWAVAVAAQVLALELLGALPR